MTAVDTNTAAANTSTIPSPTAISGTGANETVSTLTHSASSTTSASNVFNTAELLEHILHFLPWDDIVRAREVNTFAKALIVGSKKLHKSIWTNAPEIIVDSYEHPVGTAWYEEDVVLRLHGSWARVYKHVVPSHTCRVFNHPVFNVDSSFNWVWIRIELHDLLAFAKTADWKPDEKIRSDGGAVSFSLHDRKYRTMGADQHVTTLKDVYDKTTAACSAPKSRKSPGRFYVRLFLNNVVVEHGWRFERVVRLFRKAKRLFRLPTVHWSRRLEHGPDGEEMKMLKKAVAEAGKELCGRTMGALNEASENEAVNELDCDSALDSSDSEFDHYSDSTYNPDWTDSDDEDED